MKTELLEKQTFIEPDKIFKLLEENRNPSKQQIREIISKSLEIETLTPQEVACLINLKDEDLWHEIFKTALEIKKKVYDNRIVVFAPLYITSYCINNCLYCGFRKTNTVVQRKVLTFDEIKKEVQVLAGDIGHKRVIAVFGEHPKYSNIDYIVKTLQTIYSVKVTTKTGSLASIRRVNVNCAPLSVEELKLLKQAGIGTYQVFQETYHPGMYRKIHPNNTPKSNYEWRLYCMHRALEAGIEDVGIGVLYGLYDWRFEILALVCHARELEEKYGVGPHTVSFPRLEPAINTPFVEKTPYKVKDEELKKIITIIRLAIPYTGMIITARESKEFRDEVFKLGITQTDASSKIGVGSYSQPQQQQQPNLQQFILGDTRTLEELILDLAKMGYITSFCTAGYRCGRTGDKIMNLIKCGKEAVFCKLNAILTFREWIDDFATEEVKKEVEPIVEKELKEVEQKLPKWFPHLVEFYSRIKNGERDVYF
ncbi:MAG: [FeFe] hydrogenase H-cluster radical SAM maturase HydG [Elusimicrobiota bacterium]|nr:[FeFe] hydrogenase H-cluster radical SAM maturase HydG [Elusimicrobiota bacterium]